jgi:hypothetical protein
MHNAMIKPLSPYIGSAGFCVPADSIFEFLEEETKNDSTLYKP